MARKGTAPRVPAGAPASRQRPSSARTGGRAREVHPSGALDDLDGLDGRRGWSVATWLMFASSLWSALVVWQLVTSGDETQLSPGGGVPWLLVVVGTVALAGSLGAVWLLREGEAGQARLPLAIVAISGAFGIFSTVTALVCLWLTRSGRA